MNKFFAAAVGIIFCSPLFAADAPAAAPIVVRVYHTNDVHGWIMARPDKKNPALMVGGAPAFKSVLNHEDAPKLVLDAGDWWQGTPEGSLTKGAASVEVFNAIGYDAVEIGNHEWDAGPENLQKLVGQLKMPVLAANIYGADGKRVPWAVPHIIKEVGGVKFGIFGLLTSQMNKLEFPKYIDGYMFRREVDEAKDQVAALKNEGADVIIAVTHVGYLEEGRPPFESDQTIAREVPGIDLIVGGHTHTFLRKAFRDPTHGTLIVQAGCYLAAFGRTTLKIDPATHHVISAEDELTDLKPALGEDPMVKLIVDRRMKEAGAQFGVVVATVTAPLERRAGDRESAIGDWLTDCLRRRFSSDVAIHNGGGIRSDIAAGPLTVRGIFQVMPFDNYVLRLTMTGVQLRSTLEHGVGMSRLIQESGADIAYSPAKPLGARISTISVGGKPLDDAKLYTVATNNFLVEGGDGYTDFAKAHKQEQTGVLERDAFVQCAREQSTITPPAPGRLKALGE